MVWRFFESHTLSYYLNYLGHLIFHFLKCLRGRSLTESNGAIVTNVTGSHRLLQFCFVNLTRSAEFTALTFLLHRLKVAINWFPLDSGTVLDIGTISAF